MIDCAGVGRTSIACQCASISPGISVRPPPSIRVAPSAAIGSVEIVAMTLPWTSTFDGAESVGPVPSKMRTFSKRTSCRRGRPGEAERRGGGEERSPKMKVTTMPPPRGFQRPPSILRWRWAMARGP